MTNGEVPTTAENQQAPETGAAQERPAAEQSASAAAAQGDNAPVTAQAQPNNDDAAVAAAAAAVAEAPVQVASVADVPAKPAKAKADADKDAEKEDAEAEEAPADLAMAQADIAEVIAAADGGRAMPGADAEAGASLLAQDIDGDGDRDGGGFIIPAMALVAFGLGVAMIVGGGDDADLPDSPPPPNAAPVITSGATADADENIGTDEVVYTATATDADGDDVTFSLEGEDADMFEIDEDTGEVTFVASPDFEAQDSYTFTVVATDSEGAEDTQAVTLTINDVDENVAPVITSGETVTVEENIAVDTVVYTVVATDADGDDLEFSLTGEDAELFEIDADTGEVRFIASPDFEADASYSFNVVATDPDGLSDTQAVTVNVTDVDETVPPVFTSPTTVTVAENTETTTVVYTAVATDPDGGEVTYSLAGEDAAAFTIDGDTGEIRFVGSPDFETDASYTIGVVATDDEGQVTIQPVTVTITDVVETDVVFLDLIDTDNNPNTANVVDASGDDTLFVEDSDLGSFSVIQNFEEGDLIQFDAGAEVSFSTAADDANDLQIIVNNNGVVSEIILDDVLADDVGIIFNEATAEAAVGFDFFQFEAAAPAAAISNEATFA